MALGGGPERFAPGERVVIREVLDGKVWTARPVEVIEDSERQLVTYLAPGNEYAYPEGVEHGRVCFTMWLARDWELGTRVFEPPGVLRIAPRQAPFEVFADLREGGGVQRWYVNFEQPLERTALGFDTFDETLDLLVAPDCSSWTRKDEDELELARSMGFYTDAEVARIDAACRAVEEALGRGAVPWDLTWASWRPGAG